MIAPLLVTVKDAMRSSESRVDGPIQTLTAPEVASREYIMRRVRGFCALLLVALILGLTPLAYADPPDPTWIGGYWDDDDFDNVVAFIASTCAVPFRTPSMPGHDGRPSPTSSLANRTPPRRLFAL